MCGVMVTSHSRRGVSIASVEGLRDQASSDARSQMSRRVIPPTPEQLGRQAAIRQMAAWMAKQLKRVDGTWSKRVQRIEQARRATHEDGSDEAVTIRR